MKMTAHQEIRAVQSLKPTDVAAGSAAGTTGVDCKGFEEALVLLNLGTATGTLASAKLQESDDDVDGNYVTVTDADGNAVNFGAFTSSNDDALYVGRVDLTKRKRYLRILHDVDTNPVLMSISFLLLGAKEKPVSQVAAAKFNV